MKPSTRLPPVLLYFGLLGFLLALLALLALPAPRLGAQEGAPVLELSLEEFLREAVRVQPAVEEAHLQWLIRYRLARAEWGAFEPALAGHFNVDSLERENTSLQQILQLGALEFFEVNDEYALGLEGKLPSGGSYRLGGSVTRMENSYAEDGEFESFFGVSGEQPLLRGLSHGAALAPLRAARQERYIAFHEYRRQLMETILKAEQAYWGLAFAQRALEMEEESLRIAASLARDAGLWVQTGKMSALDQRQAEAELAMRQARQADAAQNLRDAVTQLKLLMAGARLPEQLRIVATDPLLPAQTEAAADPQAEREASIEWARRAQPEYMVRREQLRLDTVLLRYRQSQVLPELVLKGSYGLRGLGDTAAESFDRLESGRYPAWNLGLEMRAPFLLGLRERNELQAARLKKRLAEVRLQSLEYEMCRSIEAMLGRVRTLRARSDSLQRVVEVKKELLAVELARLEAGTSDMHLVYDAEEELSEARRDLLQAIVRFRGALLDLAVVRGSALLDLGLERLEAGQVVLADELVFRGSQP
jgi:outer membrane protein TolC